VDTQDYSLCDTPAEVPQLPTGITVTAGTPASGYTAKATSKSGNTFSILKNTDGSITRSCTTGGNGGCQTGGVW
jgi:hypothetical protein